MTRYIKQWGERRSGTCWLNVLLARNYRVRMLTHLLGWKHGAPEDPVAWERYLRNPANHPRPTNRLQGSNEAAANRRKGHMAAPTPLMLDVADHLVTGNVRYAISIKSPYSWIVSALDKSRRGSSKFHDGGLWLKLINGFNARYKSWMQYAKTHSSRVQVARYEDLLRDHRQVLARMEKAFELSRKGPGASLRAVDRYIGPGENVTKTAFQSRRKNTAYYLGGGYLLRIPSAGFKMLENQIDWRVMAWYGYKPMKGR